MKKIYVKPEMEVTELLGTDTICHASIYTEKNDGTYESVDFIAGDEDENNPIITEPVWID